MTADEDRRAGLELRRLARGGSVGLVGFATNAALTFVAVLMVSRGLTLSDAGALFQCVALFTILSNIGELGADTGLLRYAPATRWRPQEELRRLLLTALMPPLVFTASVAGALYVGATEVAELLDADGGSPVATLTEQLRWTALLLPCAVLTSVLTAGLRAWGVRQPVMIQYVLVPSSRVLLLGGLLSVGMTPTAAALAWVLPFAISSACAAWSVTRAVRRNGSAGTGGATAPEPFDTSFWSFSLARSVGAAFSVLISWLDVILVGALSSSADAAIYTIASRYVTVGLFPLSGVQYAVAPQISRLFAEGDSASAAAVYRASTTWSILACWPSLVLLMAFGGTFMGLFGVESGPGEVALGLLAGAMLVNAATGVNGTVLVMAGGSGTNLAIAAVSFAANTALNLLLIPELGVVGAALAWLVSIVLTSCLTAWALKRSHGIPAVDRDSLRAIGLTVASFGAAALLWRALLGDVVVGVVMCALVGTAVIALALRRDPGLVSLPRPRQDTP